jgi:hypothetical protein
MEKKLQDYLHYYIGANVFLCKNLEGNNVIEPLTPKMLHEDIDMFIDPDDPKPFRLLLRRLEDISDEEWLEIESETSIAPDAIGWHGVRESIMTMETRHRFHWVITNEVLIMLRKLSIDVDGLIKSGLAIDAATLTK